MNETLSAAQRIVSRCPKVHPFWQSIPFSCHQFLSDGLELSLLFIACRTRSKEGNREENLRADELILSYRSARLLHCGKSFIPSICKNNRPKTKGKQSKNSSTPYWDNSNFPIHQQQKQGIFNGGKRLGRKKKRARDYQKVQLPNSASDWPLEREASKISIDTDGS